jgi:hypothetical protein
LTKILESLNYDPFHIDDIVFMYELIDEMKSLNYFPNMGGDMLVLASSFIIAYLSSNTIDVKNALLNASYMYCSKDNDATQCNTIMQQHNIR